MQGREPKFVRQSSKDFPIQFSPELLSIIYTASVVDPSKLLLERLLDGEIGVDADLYTLNSGALFKEAATPKKSSESLIKEFVKFVSHSLGLKQRDALCQNLIIVEFDQRKDDAFRNASTSLAKVFLRAEVMHHARAELREKMLELENMQAGFAVPGGGTHTSEKAAQLRSEYIRVRAELLSLIVEGGLPDTLKRQIKLCIIPGMEAHIIPGVLELSKRSREKVDLKFTIANFIVFHCFTQNATSENYKDIYAQIEAFDETKELALSDEVPKEAIEDRVLLNKYLQGQKECVLPFFALKPSVKNQGKTTRMDEVEMEVSHGNKLRPTCSQSGH